MDISWSTFFSSIGASVGACGTLVWLCREWISVRLQKSIQHEYDVKLEDFKSRIHYEYDLKLESSKTDFQKVLDEHQTRFKYWHDEKAKAIKELHSNAGDLFYSLCYLHGAESTPQHQWVNNDKEEVENELKKQVFLNMQKTINEWIKLRLFLNDEEDSVFKVFNDKTQMWFKVLLNPDSEQRIKYIEDNQAIMLKDIEDVLNKLRTCFQASLKNDISIFQEQNDDALKVPNSLNEDK